MFGLGIPSKLRQSLAWRINRQPVWDWCNSARAGRLARMEASVLSLNFHSAPCIAVQRGAKFGGALPQPFVCLVDRTRPMWIDFRVSVSDHCHRFGNCLGFAIPARRMDHRFARLLQYLRAPTKRTSARSRYWTRHSVKTSTKSRQAYDEKLV